MAYVGRETVFSVTPLVNGNYLVQLQRHTPEVSMKGRAIKLLEMEFTATELSGMQQEINVFNPSTRCRQE